MSMKMTSWNYAGKSEFLVTVDHYVALGHKAPRATSEAPGASVLINGRRILRAGTIWRDSGNNAIGLVADDYDLTDGDKQIAVVVHGFVDRTRLPSAPSYADEQAMHQIQFVGGTAPVPDVSDSPEYFCVDVQAVSNGSLTPEPGAHRIVVKGGSYAFKVAASSGYHVSEVTANGTELIASASGVYTVSNIQADQTIAVTTAAD